MVPHKIPAWFQQIFPGFTWKRPPSKTQKVYLTFDDGPIPEVTEFVLDQLQKFGAKATFFCVGDNLSRHPSLHLRLLQAGHRAANHTFNHLSGWSTENQRYFENIALCQALLAAEAPPFQESAQPKPLFRPPYGRVGASQAKVLRAAYELVMWDVLSGDYERTIGREKCLRNTLYATESGSIVVFHDSQKAFPNLQYVLPRYLEALAEKGTVFDAL